MPRRLLIALVLVGSWLSVFAAQAPDVPHGTVTKSTWKSTIFPGTERDYWVYVPAQYDKATPAAVMVFQDGAGYIKPDGNWKVHEAFDRLIAAGEMPVTIGIFINPGIVPPTRPDALPRFNRSFEYDAVSDRYARFLIEEVLPEVGKQYNLTTDPNLRAIGGASSGAIAAFTVAWQRPDAFRRVFSTIGTYVGLRGGNDYATYVRKTEPKPLRVFLQDGSNDLNIYGGNWWVANQDMLSALEFAGYEVESCLGRRWPRLEAWVGHSRRRPPLALEGLDDADSRRGGLEAAADGRAGRGQRLENRRRPVWLCRWTGCEPVR